MPTNDALITASTIDNNYHLDIVTCFSTPKRIFMSNYIISGAILFTLALIFYSIAIWHDYLQKHLKVWHVNMFAIGVLTDALGTLCMYLHVGHLIFSAHSISGFLGLFLMMFHLGWGVYVVSSHRPERQVTFHKFSIFVWFFWLVSYVSGVYIGLNH